MWKLLYIWHLQIRGGLAHILLNCSSLAGLKFSPPHWDAPPFAVNLHHAHNALVCNNTLDLFAPTLPVRRLFFDEQAPAKNKKKVQKLLSSHIKPHLYSDDALSELSRKSEKHRIFITPLEIKKALDSMTHLPFVVPSTFIKVLTNALCTTSRINLEPTYC